MSRQREQQGPLAGGDIRNDIKEREEDAKVVDKSWTSERGDAPAGPPRRGRKSLVLVATNLPSDWA